MSGWAVPVFAQPESAEAQLAKEYFNDGEYQKALDLYQKLHKSDPTYREYSTQLLECLLQLDQNAQAVDWADKLAKKFKTEVFYSVQQGYVLERSGRKPQAETLWNELIAKRLREQFEFAETGQFFIQKRNFEFARKTYTQARVALKQPALFAAELAFVHQFLSDWGQAATELVTFLMNVPGQTAYVQSNLFQMIRPENRDAIEKALLASLNTHNQDVKIQELLYEFYVQTENWREALLQAKSIDKVKRERGTRVFRLAQTLQNNRLFDLSNDGLEYIIKNYKDSQFYLESFQEKCRNFELKAADTRPVDTVSLRKAVRNYDELFQQFGRQPNLVEAMYNKARLCLFQLNDLACAEAELQALDQVPLPQIRKAEARLLMGDILLMKGLYPQAVLKYSEVSEAFKEAQVGSMAKFREAKLQYYKGDFETAKSYLNILKDNTQNDIANDAIQLFLLIQDNIGLDTTTTALQRFAYAQLLNYQKQLEPARQLLDSVLYAFPNHPLTDDIYWELSKIYLQQGQVDTALSFYDKILEKHGQDVLADDALFAKAEIVELVHKNLPLAQELYLKLLLDYPGSLYKVEARKRIRRLRGEKLGDL